MSRDQITGRNETGFRQYLRNYLEREGLRPNGTGVELVARRAGVSKKTVYAWLKGQGPRHPAHVTASLEASAAIALGTEYRPLQPSHDVATEAEDEWRADVPATANALVRELGPDYPLGTHIELTREAEHLVNSFAPIISALPPERKRAILRHLHQQISLLADMARDALAQAESAPAATDAPAESSSTDRTKEARRGRFRG